MPSTPAHSARPDDGAHVLGVLDLVEEDQEGGLGPGRMLLEGRELWGRESHRPLVMRGHLIELGLGDEETGMPLARARG